MPVWPIKGRNNVMGQRGDQSTQNEKSGPLADGAMLAELAVSAGVADAAAAGSMARMVVELLIFSCGGAEIASEFRMCTSSTSKYW